MKAKKYELPTHRLLTFCVCFFMFLLYCCKIDAQTYNYTKSGFQPWKAVSDSTTIDLPIDSVVSLEPLVPQVSRKRKKIVQSLATTTDPFSHIPTSINIDTSKDVGEIPFSSGLSSSGGVTYSIPIVGVPGRNGFQPNISINYNSQGSNDVLGYGWSIGGLSAISRVPKNIYYDGKTEPIALDNNDAFILDGMRLLIDGNDCEPEQGNMHILFGTEDFQLTYFFAEYPDGTKAMYRKHGDFLFPLTQLTDAAGNIIDFIYEMDNNRCYIDKIQYGAHISGSSHFADISFSYKSRTDVLIGYEKGVEIKLSRLLDKIECHNGTSLLHTYTFTYQTDKVSLLTQVDCDNLNPLRFYYGYSDNTREYFGLGYAELATGYIDYLPMTLAKGKMNYGMEDDALVAYPQRSTCYLYKPDKNSPVRYASSYHPEQELLFYKSLSEECPEVEKIIAGDGFQLLTMFDVDGMSGDEVVKINNSVENGTDRLYIRTYKSAPGIPITLSSTITFDSDAAGEGFWPKGYYPGDYNGDGKIELLVVSMNKPLGLDKESKCYLFDLSTGQTLYNMHVFNFDVQNSAIIPMDVDGDGKTDICHIRDGGIDVYSFTKEDNVYSLNPKFSSATLTYQMLENRLLIPGDINGDGKVDFLLSPEEYESSSSNSLNIWTIFSSTGQGFSAWEQQHINYYEGHDFILQDANSDGLVDLIERDSELDLLKVYFNKDGWNFEQNSSGDMLIEPYSRFVASSVALPNYYNFLLSVCSSSIYKFYFSKNESKQRLLTGVVNSLGIIQKNTYYRLNDDFSVQEGGTPFYQKGTNASFPYENFQGPLWTIYKQTSTLDGTEFSAMSYEYENAILHRQGLGFCSFTKILSYDMVRNRLSTRTFDPFQRGVLIKEVSPVSEINYSYNVDTNSNTFWRKTKINLTSVTTEDLLTNTTLSKRYGYDEYNNPISETHYIGGLNSNNIEKVITQTYLNKRNDLDNVYFIGLPLVKEITNWKNNELWKQSEEITYKMNTPFIEKKIIKVNGNKVGETRWTYDDFGNILTEKAAPYSATEFLGKTYTYDTDNRYLKTVTDALGRTTTTLSYDKYGNPLSVMDFLQHTTNYTYDNLGRAVITNYPDDVTKSNIYTWSNVKGSYLHTQTVTGKPQLRTFYDALNREIRNGDQRFDGTWRYIDTEYDRYGRLKRTSLPFKGNDPTLWNTYTYDEYDRTISLIEASGKTTTTSYNGRSITVVSENISTTRTYDESGKLVAATDPGGSISYIYRPDGQLKQIIAPDNIITSFEYDSYGRQTKLIDPSAGTQTYSESYSGNIRTITQTNANNKTITSVFDKYGRITSKSCPEFTTNYSYDPVTKQLASATSTNFVRSYIYDDYGRVKEDYEKGEDSDIFLRREYSYANGNCTKIKYHPSAMPVIEEEHVYAYGNLLKILLNGEQVYFILEEDNFGHVIDCYAGDYYWSAYDNFGVLKELWAGTDLVLEYKFDVQTGNMMEVWDSNVWFYKDNFTYDHLNRLSNVLTHNKQGNKTSRRVDYDNKGNITFMDGIGSMEYAHPTKPYAVTGLNSIVNSPMQTRDQSVTYTSFYRPQKIQENGFIANFSYDDRGKRIKTSVFKSNNETVRSRSFLGDCYEVKKVNNTNDTHYLYIGGDAYSALTVCTIDNTKSDWEVYNIARDYTGRIRYILYEAEYSYDAWGRLRNGRELEYYEFGTEPELFLGRGYGSHEYLPEFGLVNMNARLYDPALGRFLSPDPYVQAPDFTQSFNRYSYCLNNPLKYTDPSGELPWLIPAIVGAAIGAYSGGVIANDGQYNPIKWDYSSVKTWGYMLGGATVGGVSGYAGWAIASSGLPMANTVAITGSSLINSVGTWVYTGGQTPISMSLGVASFDFTNGTVGYLGKKGNTVLENIGYSFGALANLTDAVSFYRGSCQNIKVNSASTKGGNEWWGHSSITNERGYGLVSVGPDSPVQKSTSSLSETWKNSIKGAKLNYETYLGTKGTWSVELNNVSTLALNEYVSGVTRWDLLFNSCVGHTSRALWSAGVPNIYLFHPHFLNAQLFVRQLGIYSSPYLYQIP